MNNGFIGLVRNENMKIYNRPRTWILVGILLLVVISVAVIVKQVSPDTVDEGWHQVAKEQIQENNEFLQNLEDIPAPFRAAAQQGSETQNLELQYHLEQNINPYEQNSWNFVHSAAGEMVPLIIIFVIIIASSTIASDFTSGSIKMLMIRPHHRWSILLSKYVASLVYTFVMVCLLFFFVWLVGNILFGFGSLTDTAIFVKSGEIVEETASVHTLKIMSLEFITSMVLMTLAFMLATLFRSNALAIGIGIFTGYVVSLDMVLAQFEMTKYLVVTNLDLAYYLTNVEGKIEGTTITFSLIVIALYWLIFMMVTWLVFQKRDIST